jgi:hypothetical protein
MSLSQNWVPSGQLAQEKASRVPVQASRRPAAGRAAAGYVRFAGPVLRGPAGVVIAVAFLAADAAAGGRAGLGRRVLR